MKTLKELVIDTKCRRGKSDGTTKRGAFWQCIEPIKIRSYGGDGVGQSSADVDHHLELRHFRDNSVRAVVHIYSWHQDHEHHSYIDVSNIVNCQSTEDVIVVLKSIKDRDTETYIYSDSFEEELTERLQEIGLPEALPSPDEQ